MGAFDGLGFRSALITANGSTVLGTIGPGRATAAASPIIQGILRALKIDASCANATITLLDGTVTIDVIACGTAPVPTVLRYDRQLQTNLTVTMAGSTSPNAVVTYL